MECLQIHEFMEFATVEQFFLQLFHFDGLEAS